MQTKRYKCVVSYLGYGFNGWAKQKNVTTIQETIEKELSSLLQENINIFASGRTDKYVHAFNQVFHFKTSNIQIKPEVILEQTNKKLNSKNIYLKSIDSVDDKFHARFCAKSKTYIYIINIGKFNLLENDLVYQYNKKLDFKKIKKCSKLFIGENNFLSFSTSEIQNNIRTINSIKVFKKHKKIFIKINGNGFLRNMVRMIVATMILFANNEINENKILYLLKNPKKGSAIVKAPGCGLYLDEVFY